MNEELDEIIKEVDVEFDEIEQPTIAIEFSLDVKKVIVGWILLLVAYFALSLHPNNWNILLLQTAIVVGAGILILVIYERAGGNIVELPTVDWKALSKFVVSLIIVIASVVIGAATLILGFMWMYDLFPYSEIRAILTAILLVLGAGMLFLAYQELKKLLGEDEDKCKDTMKLLKWAWRHIERTDDGNYPWAKALEDDGMTQIFGRVLGDEKLTEKKDAPPDNDPVGRAVGAKENASD